MDILDTTGVIPDEPEVHIIREFYQNQPRIVQVTFTGGMGEIAFYGRLTASHEWQLIFTTDENMMRGMFLPKLIKVEVLSIDPTTRIVVSLNVSEARNDLS